MELLVFRLRSNQEGELAQIDPIAAAAKSEIITLHSLVLEKKEEAFTAILAFH